MRSPARSSRPPSAIGAGPGRSGDDRARARPVRSFLYPLTAAVDAGARSCPRTCAPGFTGACRDGRAGKRAIEGQVVASLIDSEQPEPFRTELTPFREGIEAADWYALSARPRGSIASGEALRARVRGAGARLRPELPQRRARHALVAGAGSHAAQGLPYECTGRRSARSRGGSRAR